MDTKRGAPVARNTRIRQILEENGCGDVRFERVCLELGVSLATVYAWERGEFLPNTRHYFPLLHTLRALTGAEICVDDLFEFEAAA